MKYKIRIMFEIDNDYGIEGDKDGRKKKSRVHAFCWTFKNNNIMQYCQKIINGRSHCQR